MLKLIDGGVTAALGFTASGVHCGIRKNKIKKDLALIVSEVPASAAAVYTTNLVKGAPLTVTKNNMWSAIENAAFLTGVERNGDLVQMSSYETTLGKINAQVRDTSLIWFNSHRLLLTPDYYMQMLFANNVGTHYVNVEDELQEGVYRSVTVDTDEKVIYVKLVNSTKTPYRECLFIKQSLLLKIE